jgi:hypothetical protein
MAEAVKKELNKLTDKQFEALKSHANAVKDGKDDDKETSYNVLDNFSTATKIGAIVMSSGGIIWLAKFISRHVR